MLAHPKPLKAPKVRTRIARRSAPKRGSRVKKQRMTERAKLGRIATDLCSRITIATARNNMCANCFCRPTDAAHVLNKKVWPSVRYYLPNLLPLCRDHHDRLKSARLVGPSPMRDLLIQVRGRECWAAIVTRAGETRKQDMEEVVRMLRAEAEKLGIQGNKL